MSFCFSSLCQYRLLQLHLFSTQTVANCFLSSFFFLLVCSFVPHLIFLIGSSHHHVTYHDLRKSDIREDTLLEVSGRRRSRSLFFFPSRERSTPEDDGQKSKTQEEEEVPAATTATQHTKSLNNKRKSRQKEASQLHCLL